MTMTKEQLNTRRLELIADLNTIGQAPLDTPAGKRREEVIVDLRNVNAAIKQLNIDEARRAKSDADRKRARGVAEHIANLERAGVPPEELPAPAPAESEPVAAPAPKRRNQTPCEFVLWQATQLRKTLRRFKHPLPHTAEFLPVLAKFIDQQAEHLRDEAKAHDAASGPNDWEQTWRDDVRTGKPPAAEPVTAEPGGAP